MTATPTIPADLRADAPAYTAYRVAASRARSAGQPPPSPSDWYAARRAKQQRRAAHPAPIAHQPPGLAPAAVDDASVLWDDDLQDHQHPSHAAAASRADPIGPAASPGLASQPLSPESVPGEALQPVSSEAIQPTDHQVSSGDGVGAQGVSKGEQDKARRKKGAGGKGAVTQGNVTSGEGKKVSVTALIESRTRMPCSVEKAEECCRLWAAGETVARILEKTGVTWSAWGDRRAIDPPAMAAYHRAEIDRRESRLKILEDRAVSIATGETPAKIVTKRDADGVKLGTIEEHGAGAGGVLDAAGMIAPEIHGRLAGRAQVGVQVNLSPASILAELDAADAARPAGAVADDSGKDDLRIINA